MEPRDNPQYALYYKAIDADQAYSAELWKQFGNEAGRVRYTPRGRGAKDSKLRQLHDEFMRATTEHINDMRARN